MTTNNSIEAAAKLLEVLNEYAEITDELWLDGKLDSLENYNVMFFTRNACKCYVEGREINTAFIDDEFAKLDKLSESKYAELYPKELWAKMFKATQEMMSFIK
jgi:two-component SAPR family response regulator